MVGYDKETGSRTRIPVTSEFEVMLRVHGGERELAIDAYLSRQKEWFGKEYPCTGLDAVRCVEMISIETDTRVVGWQVDSKRVAECGRRYGIKSHDIDLLQEYANLYAENNVRTIKERQIEKVEELKIRQQNSKD